MKKIIAAVPLTERDLLADVPEGAVVCGVAFIPTDKRVLMPGSPPDMPVAWINCAPERPTEKRRFVVMSNGFAYEEGANELAVYVGTAVSPVSGTVIHVLEIQARETAWDAAQRRLRGPT